VKIAVNFQKNNFLSGILIGSVMGNDLEKVDVQNGLLNIFEANIPAFFQKLILPTSHLKSGSNRQTQSKLPDEA